MQALSLSRRSVLKVGGLGLLGLSYPDLLQASRQVGKRASAHSIIFLHQWGGPGQHETFDPKPEAPDNIRGWYTSTATKVPGLQICDQLPELASIADKLCIIRCMAHDKPMKNHNPAGYYSLTGVPPPTDDIRLRDTQELFPAYGSIVSKLLPAPRGVATYVSYPHTISDGSITPGQHASFLGKVHDPLFFKDDPNRDNFQIPELSLPEGVSLPRLEKRQELLKIIDEQSGLLEKSALAGGLSQSYEQAISLLTSKEFRQAFDLSREKPSTRDRYGRTTYGQSCLLARRLVEAGAKFVHVYYSRSIGGKGNGWDYHGFRGENVLDRLKELLPHTDRTLSALVRDLDERGLLQSTLVVWVGEFGRTPAISKNGGRDHWPQCYNAVLAGGGTKPGFVYGRSDKSASIPTEGRATPEDLAATMFHCLGLDPETEIHDSLKRPLPISRGSVLHKILS